MQLGSLRGSGSSGLQAAQSAPSCRLADDFSQLCCQLEESVLVCLSFFEGFVWVFGRKKIFGYFGLCFVLNFLVWALFVIN